MARSYSDAVRVGVVGLGRISSVHLDAVLSHPHATLVAVCDTDAAKLSEVARRLGVRGHADYRELVAASDIDAVLLLLPHDLHHPAAITALEQGKHVCVEKPLAATASDCDGLIECAERLGLILSVAHNLRFVPALIETRRLIDAGAIGQLRLIRNFNAGSEVAGYLNTDPRDDWRRQRNGVSALMDVAVHYFYLLKWFYGEVAALQAITRHVVPGIDAEDYALVSGVFCAGGMFTVEVTLTAELPWQERLQVYGSEGSVTIDHRVDPPVVWYRGADDVDGAPLADVKFDPRGWRGASIRAAVEEFIDAIHDGRTLSVSAADAAYAVRLVEKARESVAMGGARVLVGSSPADQLHSPT